MSGPLEVFLERLEQVREVSLGCYRACCPGHGGSNPTALSIRLGDSGGVLVKCWHGCEIEQIVGAIGLSVAELFPKETQVGQGHKPSKRRRLLTDREALDMLHVEATLVAIVAGDLAAGIVPSQTTVERLELCAGRVGYLLEEARA